MAFLINLTLGALIMFDLDPNWIPSNGRIYTWFCRDRYGRIAMMTNNCWGTIPNCLLTIIDINELLTDINEYAWNESNKFNRYVLKKNSELVLDMYSQWRYIDYPNKEDIINELYNQYNSYNGGEISIVIDKGFFMYEAVEGNEEGEDYPVGYKEPTKMGDYFRFVCPTVFGNIEDFPKELWRGIPTSDSIDFMRNIVLDKDKINLYFPRTYC